MAEPDIWVWVPFSVEREHDGLRVDQFLTRRLPAYSRNKVQKILENARVMKSDRPLRASSRVRMGEHISVAYPRRPEKPLPRDASLPVLYEDDDFLFVNKPAGLLSHPTDKVVEHTVVGILRYSRRDLAKLHLLHRLDRETSGVLGLAKNPSAARGWTRSMDRHDIQKEYIAIVRGIPREKRGLISWPIGREGGDIKVRQWVNVPDAVPAVTEFQVERIYRNALSTKSGVHLDKVGCTLVRAFPRTGRLHQIRVHFAALGHPLLGDVLYSGHGEFYLKMVRGTLLSEDRESLGFPRVALHAAALSFEHPGRRRKIRVEAALPDDMAQFEKYGVGPKKAFCTIDDR